MPRRRLPGQSYSYSKHYWPVPSSALLHTENPENRGSPPHSASFRRSPPPPRTMSPTPAGYLEPPHDGVAPMPRVYTRSRSSELLCYLNRLHCSETGARIGTGQGVRARRGRIRLIQRPVHSLRPRERRALVLPLLSIMTLAAWPSATKIVAIVTWVMR